MTVVGILLAILSIAVLCWLLFALAVYALPFFAAVSIGMWVYGAGTGPFGAVAVALIAGVLTLVTGQLILAFVHSTWIRLAAALLFAAPAALAGYHATHDLARLTIASEDWQIAFSILGALIVALTAWVRMISTPPPVRPV